MERFWIALAISTPIGGFVFGLKSIKESTLSAGCTGAAIGIVLFLFLFFAKPNDDRSTLVEEKR